MDAKRDLKHALLSRHAPESPERPADRSHGLAMAFAGQPSDAAPHLCAVGHGRAATFDRFGPAIFKRTLYAADLKPACRDVAKELFEADRIPLLKAPDKRQSWKTNKADFASGYLCKYAEQAGAAPSGARTRPGGAAEIECYVDI